MGTKNVPPIRRPGVTLPQRMRALGPRLRAVGVEALLVTEVADLRYLTQYPAQDAWLLVTPQQAFYITDPRYIHEVSKALPGVTVVRFEKSLADEVVRLCIQTAVTRLGVDERYLTVSQYKRLKALSGKKIVLKPADSCVAALRMIKDPVELELIRQAITLDLAAYKYINRYIKVGVSEKDLLGKLEGFTRRHGASFSFDPIIASGPHSAFPHARVTDRKLCSNEPVLIDLGMDIKGYKSDLTRMFFLGKMPPSYSKAVSRVREAQAEAFRCIRPGVAAREVDAAARSYLGRYDLAAHFSHSLGHGVGLEVHEHPRLSVNSDVILQENMVCTVEPGVYFPGKYGIRLEEMVLVTKNGCEVLSVNYDQ